MFVATNGDMAMSSISSDYSALANWILDYQTPEPAIVTDTSFEVGGLAIMYDKDVGESEWSTAFVDMPYKDSSNPAQFQAYLSDLSTNSLLGSWLEVGDIAGTVEGD